MVRTRSEIEQVVQKYIDFVSQVFYLKKAYLFGSYAKGTANEWSDIDLALVSPDFEYIPKPISMKILSKMNRNIDVSIEAIPFTEGELVNPELGTLAYDLVKQGIVIWTGKSSAITH